MNGVNEDRGFLIGDPQFGQLSRAQPGSGLLHDGHLIEFME
jgi:hypothetical protein